MAFVLLLTTFARAQDSQLFFDANGNLLVQTAEITAPPQIIGQPQDRVVVPGEAASFFVVVADTRALTYQWRFNGTNISGATNDALLLQNVSTNNEGQYSVVLTNPSGSVTSAPAMLWFDSDADGVADSWELTWFGHLTNSATADFDGDGVSNLQEFLDDTNPTNSVSARYRILLFLDGGAVVKSPDQSSYTNGESVTLTAIASTNAPFHAWLGDIVTRSNPVTLVMTNNKTVHARFTPIIFTWTNLTSGDWDVGTNWSPRLAPGSNDSVVIASVVTVTLNTPADCAGVTLGSGVTSPTLTGSGTLKVRGNFEWVTGTMSGSGRTVVEAGATLNIATPSGLALNTRTLENGGTVLWTGTGTLNMNNGVITNRAGALFHARNAASFLNNGGSPRFDNAGTFRKSGNAGTLLVENGISFNNSGTVEIQTGTLRLGGGGSATGTFDAPATTSVEWTSGAYTLNGGAQFNGAGLYKINNSTVTANTGLTVGNLDLIAGTLNGTGTVTIANTITWTGGTMGGSGRTIIAPGVTLNLSNASGITLSGRTLENGGTTLRTGAGSLTLENGAVITNRAGALFDFQSAASLVSIFAPNRIDNAGTFRKSVNTGIVTVPSGINFTNYGTVDIRSGIFAANGGYFSSSGALLNCALGGTNAGAGFGQLQVAGTVTLNGGLSVDLTNGFSPALNDSFTVLTAGTRNGSFSNFFYPSNAVTMQLSNTANSVIVRVTDVFSAIPRPMLLLPELVGPDIRLTWTAVSNATYRLEFNPDLAILTNWNPIPGDVTAVTNTASKLDALSPSNRLYRVRVLP